MSCCRIGGRPHLASDRVPGQRTACPSRCVGRTLTAQSARALHAAHGFENPKQEVEFLSYRELLETLRVPPGREVTLPAFAGWCARHRQTLRLLGDLDPQALFEEFRGVIGAQPGGPLSLADYRALGTRQSLLPPAQRELAHSLDAHRPSTARQLQQMGTHGTRQLAGMGGVCDHALMVSGHPMDGDVRQR
jgi:hypothetical protein